MFVNNNGIGIILGTGANIGVLINGELIETRSGLGCILGDEGSGSHIGKAFIQDFLNNNIPDPLDKKVVKDLNLSKEKIINSVYREENPNLYLSKFSKYVSENIEDVYFRSLVEKCFNQLIEIHILPLKKQHDLKFGVVGSVGFYFQEILKDCFRNFGLSIDKILQKPIEGIVDYHLSNSSLEK